jgi:hypothetical protein
VNATRRPTPRPRRASRTAKARPRARRRLNISAAASAAGSCHGVLAHPFECRRVGRRLAGGGVDQRPTFDLLATMNRRSRTMDRPSLSSLPSPCGPVGAPVRCSTRRPSHAPTALRRGRCPLCGGQCLAVEADFALRACALPPLRPACALPPLRRACVLRRACAPPLAIRPLGSCGVDMGRLQRFVYAHRTAFAHQLKRFG